MLHLTIETLLMKKIHLSIPKPCHENWDAMTSTEKGKFCSSCQKTVIDFTNMSDRQLAEFFKKPPSSVCGRVYDDQLNRDIVIPRKRIPWIKYFFQFTWPAFVFFLKSCGMKESSKGEIKAESEVAGKGYESSINLGYIMPGQDLILTEKESVDSAVNLVKEEITTKGEITGALVVKDIAINQKKDSIGLSTDSLDEVVYKPMDTVVVVTSPHSSFCRVTLGAIVIARTDTIKRKSEQENVSLQEANFKVYPNPVQAGSLLNISCESVDDIPQLIRILTSSGQLISEVKQNHWDHSTLSNIQIPSNATAGIYFLQMITRNKQIKTTKIIVTK